MQQYVSPFLPLHPQSKFVLNVLALALAHNCYDMLITYYYAARLLLGANLSGSKIGLS